MNGKNLSVWTTWSKKIGMWHQCETLKLVFFPILNLIWSWMTMFLMSQNKRKNVFYFSEACNICTYVNSNFSSILSSYRGLLVMFEGFVIMLENTDTQCECCWVNSPCVLRSRERSRQFHQHTSPAVWLSDSLSLIDLTAVQSWDRERETFNCPSSD